MWSRIASVALLAVLTSSSTIAPAAEPARGLVDRSARKPPQLSRLTVAPTRDGVRAAFTVRFPRIGRHRRDRVTLRVAVWRSPARRTRLVQVRAHRGVGHDRIRRYYVRLRGPAARALRRASSPRRLLTISAIHHRHLDADPHADHLMAVTVRGHDVPRRTRRSVPARAAGAGKNLSVYNGSVYEIMLSAAAVQCMHDRGDQGSSVDAFNGVRLKSGQTFSHYVEANSDLLATAGYTFPFRESSDVDNVYSPELRAYLFATLNLIDGAKWAPRFTAQMPPQVFVQYTAPVANPPACLASESLFAIGVDRPTVAGSATRLFDLSSSGLNGRSYLSYRGLGLQPTSDSRIEVFGVRRERPCSSGTYDDWMVCKAPTKKLSDVAIPGTHDSGTLNLSVRSDAMIRDTRGGCSDWVPIFDLSPSTVNALAVTHPLTIREQLDAGFRYLDLRVAYDPAGTSARTRWRLAHTLYSRDTLADHVAQIVAWARTHVDPLIVDIHVCPYDGGTPDDLLAALKTPDRLTGATLCGVSLKASSPSLLPQRTVMDAAFPPAQRHVVVLLNGLSSYPGFSDCGLYPTRDPLKDRIGPPDSVPIARKWPNVMGPTSCDPADGAAPAAQMKERAGDISQYRAYADKPFVQNQILYTLHGDENAGKEIIARAATGICPGSLMRWTDTLAPWRDGLLREWGAKANVVMFDSGETTSTSDAVATMIAANEP